MKCISTSIYFNVGKNVIVVPCLQAPAGFGVASCKFIKLQTGYEGTGNKYHK